MAGKGKEREAPPAPVTNISRAAAGQLASFIERAERLAEEIAGLNGDLKEVWAEAKGVGYDVAALKRIIALRRKDPDKLQEAAAIEDTYIHALGALVDTPLGSWAREHMKADSSARLVATVATMDATSEAYTEAFYAARGLQEAAE